MAEKKRNGLRLAALLAAQILLLTLLVWAFGTRRLDGDDAGEMILADLLAREGGILSTNWYYSTELRVLNTQILTSLLFRLTDNWRLVRTLSAGIHASLMILSYLFLCSRLPEPDGERLRRWAPVVLLPFSYVYLDIVLYGMYYIPHISIMFLSLGLLVSRKRRRLDAVLLLLLAFAAGLGGIRIPAVGYAPMFAASLYAYLAHKDRRTPALSLAACFSAGAGYLVNALVLTRRYTVMSYGEIAPVLPDLQRLKRIAVQTLEVCGAGALTVSVNGAGSVCGLLLAACILCAFAVAVIRRREISMPAQTVILTYVFSYAATAAVSAFTSLATANRYFILPCIGLVPILAEGTSLLGEKLRKTATAAVASLLLVCSFAQVHRFATVNKLAEVQPAYDYILDSGMTFGYSTWEVGDVLTEVSDGRIHMCKIQNFRTMWHWNNLMEKDYMKYAQDGPVFALLDKRRMNHTDENKDYFYGSWTEEDLTWTRQAKIGFEDDKYVVWVFSSEAEFEALTGSRPHD